MLVLSLSSASGHTRPLSQASYDQGSSEIGGMIILRFRNTNNHNACAGVPFDWGRTSWAAQWSTCAIYRQHQNGISNRGDRGQPNRFPNTHTERLPPYSTPRCRTIHTISLASNLLHLSSARAGHIDKLGRAGEGGQDAGFRNSTGIIGFRGTIRICRQPCLPTQSHTLCAAPSSLAT